MTPTPLREEISGWLHKTLKETLKEDISRQEVGASLSFPPDDKFGELSSHIILKLAKLVKRPPRPLAEEVKQRLEAFLITSGLGKRISKISIEGPGFINFYFSQSEIASVLLEIHERQENFGKPTVPKKKILLEFVSANPTGPLTVAHGRQAALGDSLARIMKFCGHEVFKEYYNNDEGVQIQRLGASLRSCVFTALGVSNEFPTDGYQGSYLKDMAEALIKKCGKKIQDEPVDYFSTVAKEEILEGIQTDLRDFGVEFDRYFSQEALMKSGKVEQALDALKQKGFIYEKEGAVWFETTVFGDDKDRVLIKSDKSYTYFLPDIAYHLDKFQRGHEFLITILGPDHHGYVSRIKAAVEALGYPRQALEILIAQLVTLLEGDKTLRMSTRAGEFITLREILDEVGKDAGRFFFLMRKFDTHLDFDLALAKSQTMDNPVFYIQYAHARIESLKNLAAEKGVLKKKAEVSADALERLTQSSEINLLRLLRRYGETVLAAQDTLEPYRLIPYLQELASSFHKFYTENRVVTDDLELTQARLLLVDSTQVVLRLGLELLGVQAPLKM